jgi:ATP-binding cassette subfamily F protein 3
MIRLLLEPVNLLILDEPTNHLDMRSKDVLKQAIKEFDGTVIVVSHDREFLDGLVDKVYEFGGGKVREHLGGIYDFLTFKKMETLRELEKSKVDDQKSKRSLSSSKGPNVDDMSGVSTGSTADVKELSYEEQKELQRQKRRAEKYVELCEIQIAETEKEIAELEEKMASGVVDDAIFSKHGELKKKLEEQMVEWEDALSKV